MFFRTLTIIHVFLVLGLAALGAASFFFGVGFVNQFSMSDDIYIYIIPTLALLGYFASTYIFRKQLSAIDKNDSLQTKQAKYQQAIILKYAFIEGPALLAFMQFMNQGYTLYFTIGACLTIYLAGLRPTKSKVFEDLQLNTKEKQEIK